jgi:pyruvate dehydrogenase E1 component beta subunit
MKFTEAICDANNYILKTYPESFVIGLGVSYINGADGTMGNLVKEFPNRIIDTPVSEASITGLAVGSAICGMRPIVHHGRVEFALLALDQIITQASKWNYMFGGGYNVPITFRIAVGRQWGNGPQHTQALYSLFGNITGLKVVIPSSPGFAKQLLISSVIDPNPVVFLEPRWLYNTSGPVNTNFKLVPLNKLRVLKSGIHITIVSYGDGVFDSYQAAKILEKFEINAEVIDLVSINPIDYLGVLESLKKTKILLTVDTSNSLFSVGKELIGTLVTQHKFNDFAAHSISTPNVPCPTAPSLTAEFYPTEQTILNKVLEIFEIKKVDLKFDFTKLHLAPSVECDYE